MLPLGGVRTYRGHFGKDGNPRYSRPVARSNILRRTKMNSRADRSSRLIVGLTTIGHGRTARIEIPSFARSGAVFRDFASSSPDWRSAMKNRILERGSFTRFVCVSPFSSAASPQVRRMFLHFAAMSSCRPRWERQVPQLRLESDHHDYATVRQNSASCPRIRRHPVRARRGYYDQLERRWEPNVHARVHILRGARPNHPPGVMAASNPTDKVTKILLVEWVPVD